MEDPALEDPEKGAPVSYAISPPSNSGKVLGVSAPTFLTTIGIVETNNNLVVGSSGEQTDGNQQGFGPSGLNTTENVFQDAAHKWCALSFTAIGNYTMTRIAVSLKIGGGAPLSNAVTAALYSDTAGHPNVSIKASLATDKEMLGAAFALYSFWFTPTALTIGTRYWLVLTVAATDAVNFPTIGAQAGADVENLSRSPDGTTWTVMDANQGTGIEIYSPT